MPQIPAAFAVPGRLDARTGGTIYDRSLLEALRAAGREVWHIALPGGYPEPSAADEAASAAAFAAVPRTRPVIVDGLALGAMAPAVIDALACPLVAMVHHPLGLETGLSPERAHALVRSEAANLARARAVIVPSPHTARILAAEFGVPRGRITVAAPGFGPLDPVRAPQDPPLILAVGLLAPRKGHDVLIDALARLADLPWNAVIVGAPHPPGTAAALRDRRDALGLAGRVRFAGPLGAEALRDLYRGASLFALATRYEGYGMVLGEALLHGLPIVSCATGAVPDTVPPGTGLLVPPDAPEAFAEALRSLLADPARRAAMAGAATEAGRALPDWAATARIVGAVLDGLA